MEPTVDSVKSFARAMAAFAFGSFTASGGIDSGSATPGIKPMSLNAVLSSLFLSAAMFIAPCVLAQVPSYEELIARRTSEGFASALDVAEAELTRNPSDGAAHAVIALVYANGGDYLGMGSEAGTLKEDALLEALELAPASPFTRAAFGLIRMSTDTSEAERILA